MRVFVVSRAARAFAVLGVVVAAGSSPELAAESAEERRNWFDTPFDAAVEGLPQCPRPLGPLITEQEMRTLAHARIERGTSCWLAKKCEDSNAYRRDGEVQQRVVAAIRAQPRLVGSSVWVTTERRWVTLQGCLAASELRKPLLQAVRELSGVEIVFDQLIVGTHGAPRWTVDPSWSDQSKKKPTR